MRAGGPTSAPRLIFDPGVDDSAMLLDSVFSVLSTAYGVRPASLREGEFSVNNEIARMFNVLFDSGALHHVLTPGFRSRKVASVRGFELPGVRNDNGCE